MSGVVVFRRVEAQRRAGTLGELDTVQERLAVAEGLWSGQLQRLWNRYYAHLTMLQRIRAAERFYGRVAAASRVAARRCERRMEELLEAIAMLDLEVRAEVRGASDHVSQLRPALRIDQVLADQYRSESAASSVRSGGVR